MQEAGKYYYVGLTAIGHILVSEHWFVEAFRIRLDEALGSMFKWLSNLPMALGLEPDEL